ncbi:MAG: nitroreductase family protein [Alphaproteobacteria bacterium]|nr:nitroreductase family protein [Alphaproteobacteria bacterium]
MLQITDFYQKRRSIYALGSSISLSDNQLEKLIGECIKQAPSAFNSQSGRVALLLGNEHQKLWQIVLDTLSQITPPERFNTTKIKISSFSAGYGTILFFEDDDVIQKLQTDFPLYKDAFPSFSCQSSGMLQYMVWTALAAKNIGASLQHYNPLIDNEVKETWQIPSSWRLISQMPFGKIEAIADEKDFEPLTNRFKIFT